MYKIAKPIWFWCIEHNIWVTATHIPGKCNLEADVQSRQFNDQLEWQIDKNKFQILCQLWGKPEIASRLNTQLPVFCSWRTDPESHYVDAFTLDWNKFYAYLFPPFSLMAQCVKKIFHDKAEGIIVGPLWPTQPWFVHLLQMLVETPIIFHASDSLMTLPYKAVLHPLRKNLNLVACRVSGNSTKSEEFQKTLPKFYLHRGEPAPKNNIKHISKNGFCSVVKDRLVRFNVL